MVDFILNVIIIACFTTAALFLLALCQPRPGRRMKAIARWCADVLRIQQDFGEKKAKKCEKIQ